MRLGFEHPDDAVTCAQALADGGAASLVVHARTKVDGYKPPAYWHRIRGDPRRGARIPVFANGEVWTVDDWRRCRSLESGVDDVMLGRGLIARPDLALPDRGDPRRPTRGHADGLVRDPADPGRGFLGPPPAPRVVHSRATRRGLLKQWLVWLARSYPEAASLFAARCGRSPRPA